MLITLYDHLAWADEQTLAAVRSMPEGERARATSLYAHLASAEHVWLARLEQRQPSQAIWPTVDLDAAAAVARASAAGLRAVAAGDAAALRRVISYRNSTGTEFHSTVLDILLQVALHGSYHRGQIALLARGSGATPPLTDYIAYVRAHPVTG